MKLTKLQTAALVGVPILIGAYLIYKQLRKPKDIGAIGNYVPPPTPEPVVTPAPATSNCKYPLKKGVNNCDMVKYLQWSLNRIPYTQYDSTTNLVRYRPLVEDGDFGAKTEAVLSDFWLNSPQARANVNQVSTQAEMDVILRYVISDPAEFQAAENPYVVAPPAPEPPTTSPFPTFPTL
jgi:hypothetical protein